jgi:proteasome lid subunit RPN8/RPN11
MTSPVVPGWITYTPDVWHCIGQHLTRALPNEGCGFLLADEAGRDFVDIAVSVHNVAEEPRSFYAVDPDRQLAVWRFAEMMGKRVVGIYHSHVGAPPRMSQWDVDHARDPKLVHLIVEMTRGVGVTDAAVWRVEHDHGMAVVTPVDWQIGERPERRQRGSGTFPEIWG